MTHKKRQGSRGVPYQRTARLGELLRRIITEELVQIDDERLNMMAVTEVTVDSDMRLAKVYYSVFADEDREGVEEGLEEFHRRIKQAVAAQANIKRTPEIEFTEDQAALEGARIEAILRDVIPPGGYPDEAAQDDTAVDDTASDGD